MASEFDKIDASGQGLTDKQIIKLARTLNERVHVSRLKHKIKVLIHAAVHPSVDSHAQELDSAKTEGERGRVSCAEFVDMYKDLMTRPEIYFLMVRYANKDYLTCDDLQLFLETEQGVRGPWCRHHFYAFFLFST